MSGQSVQVVVADGLALVDDADAARVINTITKEDVVLDEIVVAVAQRQRTSRLEEKVAAECVPPGFAGDDLYLAVAAVEIVVLNDGQRIAQGVMAGADTQCFATIRTE